MKNLKKKVYLPQNKTIFHFVYLCFCEPYTDIFYHTMKCLLFKYKINHLKSYRYYNYIGKLHHNCRRPHVKMKGYFGLVATFATI